MILLAGATALLLAGIGCTPNPGSGGGTEPGGSGAYVNIYTGTPGNLTENFNPFSPGSQVGSQGAVFETLFYTNTAADTPEVPWLGTEWSVNDQGTEYSITTREGVTWHDGEPFSAKDVAYTFNLIKDHAALNLYGLKIASATATDDTHVVIKLAAADFQSAYRITSSVLIVPEHIWSTMSDPSKDTVRQPVGTGPFTFGTFSPQQYTLVKNANYWEEGKPAVAGLRFVSSTGNTAALNSLLAGQLDWAGIALTNVFDSFVDKGPNNKYTSVPSDFKSIMLNLTKAPFDDAAFRHALSLGIDRDRLNKDAFGEVDAMPNPTGILHRDERYIPAAFAGKTLDQDVERAKAMLADAGYELKGDTRLGKDGQPLELSIKTVTGYTDLITANQLLAEDFAKLGIKLSPVEESFGAFSVSLQTGDFDLAAQGMNYGPNPFQFFDDYLNSAKTAAIGKDAISNYSRYRNPEVDALLTSLRATNEEAELIKIYDKLGTIFATEQPYILLSENAATTTFRDDKFTGMPTNEDLYANPSNWLPTNIAAVAKELKPVEP